MVYPIGMKIAAIEGDRGVQFQYVIGGHTQTFVVTRAALEQYFGLSTSIASPDLERGMTRVFLAGWERVRNIAARSRKVPTTEPIALTPIDFSKRVGCWRS